MYNRLKYSATIVLAVCLTLNLFSCQLSKSIPDPLQAGWKGEPVCVVLEETSELRVLQCTFPPGVGHDKHYHVAHIGYALAGSTFRITDENGVREVAVPTGSSFTNDGIEWHEVINIGDSTAVFLIMEYR